MSIERFVAIVNSEECVRVIIVGLADQFREVRRAEEIFRARESLVSAPANIGLAGIRRARLWSANESSSNPE